MKLGYLISQFPALSHTFVLREVQALRRQGVDVHVVSVRQCDRPLAHLSAEEAEEARRTFSHDSEMTAGESFSEGWVGSGHS